MSLLSRITRPTDLTTLPTTALAVLAQEIRAFVIDKVSRVGGHLGPRFLPHASREEILRAHGLDAAGIATAVLKRLASTHRGKVTAKEM